jgi:MCP family monocarboxylic acid transporter-like MFS transporter 10
MININILLQPGYAKDLNIEEKKSSNLIGIMSVGSTFGRLFFGKLSDHPRVNRLYLYQMSFFCIGVIQTLVPQITNFAGFAMYMVTFGVFDGCFIVLLAIVVSDVVGIDKVSTGMGVKFFFMAITTFVGPPLAGKFPADFFPFGAAQSVKWSIRQKTIRRCLNEHKLLVHALEVFGL